MAPLERAIKIADFLLVATDYLFLVSTTVIMKIFMQTLYSVEHICSIPDSIDTFISDKVKYPVWSLFMIDWHQHTIFMQTYRVKYRALVCIHRNKCSGR